MQPSTELFISNIGHITSAVLMIILPGFVWLKGLRKPVNIFFFLSSLSGALYLFSHVLGTNVIDPNLSRNILMFNLLNITTVVTSVGLLFAAIGKFKEYKKSFIVISVLGLFLIVFYLFFPYLFLKVSKPVQYFPNFYQVGPLYFVMLAFFFSSLFFSLYRVFKSYSVSGYAEQNRLKYFIIGIFIAYGFGCIDFIPLYFQKFDPVVAIFLGVYTILFAYGILKDNLLDINIIAKKALVYSMAVGAVSISIVVVNSLSNLLSGFYPSFPIWIIPVTSSIVAVTLSYFVWYKFRETEVLKYEFINVVTHKFRTPLTYINWALDSLQGNHSEEDKLRSLATIREGTKRLVELTNNLVEVIGSSNERYVYNYTKANLFDVVTELVDSLKDKIAEKSLHLSIDKKEELETISVDLKRIKFVIQNIIENALMYTPRGGKIEIKIVQDRKYQTLIVHDSGVGIKKDDLPLIFSEFYRSKAATSYATEGMGIGLYISKSIIRRHGGKIWAESDGENRGSTFYIKFRVK